MTIAEPAGAAPPLEPRVSTGNLELDRILHGGLMPHRPYLVVGPSGTGKTTMALQFLLAGVRQGENCLLVTLEEPPNELRYNHRSMRPEIDRLFVFDAIPDVMRYERTPFKDIAAVRSAVPLSDVTMEIRKTPELSSVEVTFTALEQTLKTEIARHNYTRLVIDSMTALQFFCMKGVDETVGAQAFLRFLSDLRVTTLLTVELPIEDVETPERLLARGEIHLFRWEHDGTSVRAIGVEKMRGTPHDPRLHPYRITPHGLQINLELTIQRATGEIVEKPAPEDALPEPVTTEPAPVTAPVNVDPIVAGLPLEASLELVGRLVEHWQGDDEHLRRVWVMLAEAREASLEDRPKVALRLLQEARDLALREAKGWPAPPDGRSLTEILSRAPPEGTAITLPPANHLRSTLPVFVGTLLQLRPPPPTPVTAPAPPVPEAPLEPSTVPRAPMTVRSAAMTAGRLPPARSPSSAAPPGPTPTAPPSTARVVRIAASSSRPPTAAPRAAPPSAPPRAPTAPPAVPAIPVVAPPPPPPPPPSVDAGPPPLPNLAPPPPPPPPPPLLLVPVSEGPPPPAAILEPQGSRPPAPEAAPEPRPAPNAAPVPSPPELPTAVAVEATTSRPPEPAPTPPPEPAGPTVASPVEPSGPPPAAPPLSVVPSSDTSLSTAPGEAKPKRRAPRKRKAAGATAPEPDAPRPPGEPAAPTAPPPETPLPEVAAAPPKPKRRAPRKKKPTAAPPSDSTAPAAAAVEVAPPSPDPPPPAPEPTPSGPPGAA